MARFNFEALNEHGKPVKDSLSALNSEDAIARIRAQGLFPTSVREDKSRPKNTLTGVLDPDGDNPFWEKTITLRMPRISMSKASRDCMMIALGAVLGFVLAYVIFRLK